VREPANEGPRVVVGVDDSPVARWALAWAIGEARLRGMPLLVAHVAAFPQYASRAAGVPLPRDYADVKAEGAAVISALLEEVSGGAPAGIRMIAMSLVGEPGETLVRLARDGDVLVVGRSDRGPFSRLLNPSAHRYCLRHARTTVVCVRAPAPATEASTQALDADTAARSAGRRLWGLRRRRQTSRDGSRLGVRSRRTSSGRP
jgi:nucleotide-binding universal stress UspA family protein